MSKISDHYNLFYYTFNDGLFIKLDSNFNMDR